MRKKEQFPGGLEQTGHMHEIYMLGEVQREAPEYREALRQLGAREDGYLPFEGAIQIVKMFQPLDRKTGKPQDPTNPDTLFAKDLRMAIIETLGFETAEEMDQVKYYTAVGSPLDRFHGIDAFIELENAIVTFDVTLQTGAAAKLEAGANIVIKGEQVQDISRALKDIEDIAKQAAPFLKKPI